MHTLVLFDFDGTLADTAPDLALAANLQRRYRQLPDLPYERLRPHASHGARGMLKAALDMDPDDPEYPATRQRFLDDYAQAMLGARLFDGITELLAQLQAQDQPWGIVTNKIEALTRPLVQHLGLAPHCSVLVCGDTTAHTKPHPAPLLHAARLHEIPAQHCLYIGDDARDIQAGRAAGMATVAAAYGYCQPDEVSRWEADAAVQAPVELLATIEQWAATFERP